MAKTVTSTELQKNTREVIDWTRTQGEPVVIETYGKPMAAILSYKEYESYLLYRKARAVRFDELRRAAAINAAANDLTEEEAIALVESIRQEIYESYLQQEAAKGSREDFEAFLSAVPNAEPIEEDRLD